MSRKPWKKKALKPAGNQGSGSGNAPVEKGMFSGHNKGRVGRLIKGNLRFDTDDGELYTASARQKKPLTVTEKRYLDKLAWITVRRLLLQAGLLDDKGHVPRSLIE